MANKIIDATLRFVDKFTEPMNTAMGKMSKHSSEMMRAGRQIQRTGKQIESAGSNMTKSVTVPIIGLGVAAVKTAANFESGMSKVQSICGASGSEMEQLTAKAKEMGAKTKFSASEAADAFSYMAMAGWESKDMMNGIEGVMYLAGATGEDLASTSDIVTDALTAFGLTAQDTNKFVDVLAQTANKSNTNVGMLGESFKYVAPAAGALKYSVEDTSIALGLMANSGIKASQSGTALNSWFTRMAKPTKESSTAMKELGISITDSSGAMKPFRQVMQETRGAFANLSESQKAQYAAMLAGKTGMSGLLAIVNSSDADFNKLAKGIDNSTGAAKKMYNVANDNLKGRLTVLKSTVESIAISFGEKMSPTIEKFTGKLQQFADKINSLSDEQIEHIIKFAVKLATIGPALMVFGKMVTGVGSAVSMFGRLGRTISNVSKAAKAAGGIAKAAKSAGGIISLISGPAGVAVAVVLGLIAALILLVKHWDKVSAGAKKFGKWIKSVFSACGIDVDAFAKKARSGFGKFSKDLKSMWTEAKPVLMAVGQLFGTVFKIVIGGGIGAAIGYFSSFMKSVKKIFGGIKKMLGGMNDFIDGAFAGDWEKAWNGIKNIFGGAFQAMEGLARIPINAVIGIINGAVAGINKMHVKIPKWVPKYGGKEFKLDIPTIPMLARGTKNWYGGPAMIHDRGAEIVDLPKGSRVYPHDQSLRMASDQGKISILNMMKGIKDSTDHRSQKDIGKKVKIVIEKICDKIEVRDDSDIDKIADAFVKKLEEAAANMA